VDIKKVLQMFSRRKYLRKKKKKNGNKNEHISQTFSVNITRKKKNRRGTTNYLAFTLQQSNKQKSNLQGKSEAWDASRLYFTSPTIYRTTYTQSAYNVPGRSQGDQKSRS